MFILIDYRWNHYILLLFAASLVIVWLGSLSWDLTTYRKKTELTLGQILALLGLGLAAELGNFVIAAGACALLGFLLGRSYATLAELGNVVVAAGACALLGFLLGRSYTLYNLS